MIKRLFAITILIYLLFLVEFVLFNALGPWGKPELMVVAIVFCNLYWGIRYSLWAAFIAGLLKDSFGIEPFGTYVFVFIVAAYLTTVIRNTVYQPGSRFSRAVVTFFVLVEIFILEMFLHMRFVELSPIEAGIFILSPQLVITMAVVTFMFQALRDVVVKLKL